MQTEKRLDASVLAQKGALPTRRVLLEEAQRRQDDARRSHEIESSGHGGNGDTRMIYRLIIPHSYSFCLSARTVYLRMLRSLGDPANISSALLLAAAEP